MCFNCNDGNETWQNDGIIIMIELDQKQTMTSTSNGSIYSIRHSIKKKEEEEECKHNGIDVNRVYLSKILKLNELEWMWKQKKELNNNNNNEQTDLIYMDAGR